MAEALDKGVNTTTKTEEMEILLPEEDYEGKESIEEMEVVLKQEVDALREEIDKKTNELIEMKKKITDVLSEKLGPERAHDEDFQKTLSAIKNQKSLIEILLVSVSWCSEDLSFPPTFKFGAASSSYQVEGAWNVSDKSESVWDHEVHKRPEIVADGTNGDIACDSYHKYKEDVSIASKLGLHFYRFSISWPRLLPTGFPEYISEDGKNYYSKLIDELLDSGIEPVVTLFHWDLPQRLQEMGGWTNPLIADWFADYSRVVYSLYADRVKTWITINEPIVICEGGFVSGPVAPRTSDPPYENYICNKHTLLAHAKAWRVYDEEFRAQYNGQVAIDNHAVWYEAASPADEEMAEITMQYNVGRYSHAIYSAEGGWPPEIERIIAENSIKQGFRRSRLPTFTKEEIELVKGTYDYYAVNHYTSRLVRKAKPGEKTGNGLLEGAKEYGAVFEGNADWPQSAAQWLLVNPVGIRNQLKWLKQRYGDLKFFIAENGFPRLVAGLEDDDRVDFYKKYLAEVLRAIKEDGVNVVAYTAWTLLDNFEWVEGLRVKFGLYQVDFADPERKRTARKSAHYYRSVIEHHSLDVPDQYARNEL